MKELVEFIARALVDDPSAVVVREIADGGLELSASPADVGKLIGRRGRTARALRTVVRAAGGEQAPELAIAGGAELEGQETAAE